METKSRAVVLVLLSTLFTSSGQIFLKKGANQLVVGMWEVLGNNPLLLGCVLYAVGAVMLIVSLKYGELSVLYPLYALNFIWVSLLSPRFFPSDSMSALKWFGVLMVIVGVSLIGFAGRRRSP